jgi:DnaJ-class molecular chaperone
METCNECAGACGYLEPQEDSGEVAWLPCEKCEGTGVIKVPCSKCNGSGVSPEDPRHP